MDTPLDIQSLFALTGKTALVSGASSGLGEHFAQVLAAAGARVIVAARRVDRLKALVDRINGAGGEATSLALDVTSRESVSSAFEELDSTISSLDIVINNAGIANRPLRFVDATEEEWGGVLDVNLIGAWRVAQAAAIRMKKQGSGVVVNTGSIYSHVSGTHKADYNVSKVAVDQLTKNMALELARSGVRVNSFAPATLRQRLTRKSSQPNKAALI